MVMLDTEERFEKCIASVAEKFDTVRTGRANPSLLDRVQVEAYGVMNPLKNIAGMSTPDAKTFVVKPFDKTTLGDIERALMASDLGMTPNNNGEMIRLILPDLTKERRVEMTKLVKSLGEDSKVAIRNVRRDAIKAIDKVDGLGEDAVATTKDAVQKLTDNFVGKVEAMEGKKNEELTTV